MLLGADCIAGLQTARILHRRGVLVVAAIGKPGHFVASSRSVERTVDLGSTDEDNLSKLRSLASDLPGRPVLIACSDLLVRFMSDTRVALAEHYDFVLPPPDVVDLLTDKERFQQHAAAAGMQVPRSVYLTFGDDPTQALADLAFPLILKPPSKSVAFERAVGHKAVKVDDIVEVKRVMADADGTTPSVVAQEWIEGPDSNLLSFNGYFDRDGELLAGFTARKIRQWPPSAGTSAFGEEIDCPELTELATDYFSSLGYSGLIYLEMKRDARTGGLVAVEPNVGRPTGRSAVAEAGGVALHYTAYADAAGIDLPPLADRRQTFEGARWMYIRHDVQSAASLIRSGELTVAEWLRSLRGRRAYAVWSLRDPLPFLVDIQATVKKQRLASSSTEAVVVG